MSLLPEWAPNIHPVLIHFPIVLLLLAPLLDVSARIFRKQRWLPQNANLVYALAGLSVLIVYISGEVAADSVELPSQAYVTLSTHANWALYTLILGGLNAVLRGFLLFRKNDERPVQWYLMVPGLLVVILLLLTADNGAKLVYAHGVGVTAVEAADHHNLPTNQGHEMEVESHEHSHANTTDHGPADTGDQISAAQQTGVLSEADLTWIIGDAASLNLNVTQQQGQPVFSLSPSAEEALFVLPGNFSNLEYIASINRDAFQGVIRLIHHVVDTNNYDFLELDKTTVKQGRIKDGTLTTFDSGEYAASGWITLKAVSTQGHFRGYVNQGLITHGHGADLPEGKLGIYLKGSGPIQLTGLQGNALQ